MTAEEFRDAIERALTTKHSLRQHEARRLIANNDQAIWHAYHAGTFVDQVADDLARNADKKRAP